MTNWAERTYWVKVEHGGFEAIVVDEGPDIEGVLGDAGVSATKATEYEPCKGCPHQDLCMDSVWNEHRNGGPTPGSDGLDAVTSVHTCKTCTERVLSRFGYLEHERRVVPPGCPRWNATLGSATDCGACEAERDALRKAHPRYEERVQKAGELFRGWAKANAEGKAPPSAASLAEALTGGIPDPDPELMIRAQRILGALIGDIRRRFKQVEAPASQRGMMMREWLETIYLSLQRNPDDFRKVARDFVLVFNNRPPFTMAWAQTTVPMRKLIERGWGGLVARNGRLPEGG